MITSLRAPNLSQDLNFKALDHGIDEEFGGHVGGRCVCRGGSGRRRWAGLKFRDRRVHRCELRREVLRELAKLSIEGPRLLIAGLLLSELNLRNSIWSCPISTWSSSLKDLL